MARSQSVLKASGIYNTMIPNTAAWAVETKIGVVVMATALGIVSSSMISGTTYVHIESAE